MLQQAIHGRNWCNKARTSLDMDGSIDFDCYSLGRGDMITLIMLHQLKSISAKVSENTFLGM